MENESNEIPMGPMGLKNPMGLESQVVPKLGIWLSQRFLSRDCPSDICPCPKRPRRMSPDPGPKSRDSCPGTQIPWDPRPIAHPCIEGKIRKNIWRLLAFGENDFFVSFNIF